jgi:hypothetical protein
MTVSANLASLIDAVAPLFAGEAEVFTAYWASPRRNRETDKLWILRQARKEVWDTPLGDPRGLFIGPLEDLLALFPRIDVDVPRAEVLDRLEGLYEEFSHYCAFADAYDALCADGEARLSPTMLREVPDWPENQALRDRRAQIQSEFGGVGARACFFTEGGYCTMFSEGMKLKGRGGPDDLIAEACAKIYEDEFGHMLKCIVGIDADDLSQPEWDRLTELSVELQRLRIPMRNSQMSFPLSDDRIREIFAGDIEPVRFAFAQADL